MRSNTWIGAICLSLAASIWGGMYVVSKFVLKFVPPLTLMWGRYVIAFVVLFGMLMVSQQRVDGKVIPITKRDWMIFGKIGFIGYFLSIAFQFVGTKLSDAHTGALITSATPALIVLFAWWILHEKITRMKLFALLLSTLGVLITIGTEPTSGSYLIGQLLLVGAALTWALLSVYVKIASVYHSVLSITTYSILVALICTTPVMLIELSQQGWEIEWNGWIVGGISIWGSSLRQVLFTYGIKDSN